MNLGTSPKCSLKRTLIATVGPGLVSNVKSYAKLNVQINSMVTPLENAPKELLNY